MASRERRLLRDAAVPLLSRRSVPRVREERRGHARAARADGERHTDQHRGATPRRCSKWPPATRRRKKGGKIGAVGFCISGGLVISPSRAMPDRVAAVASIHGAWLVRDTPDSPHLGLDKAKAEVYFGWCDNDPTAPAEQGADREEGARGGGASSTCSTGSPTSLHGYAPPGGDRYNRAASELHWERVHAMFRRHLS